MSTYIVDNSTICKVVQALKSERIGYPHAYPDLHYLSDDQFLLNFATKEPFEMGAVLLAMNENAVNQRYSSPEPDNPFHFKRIAITPTGVYKALQCYLYQCSEGDVPELPLYKALRKYQDALARNIVQLLPEYDNLPWG